MSLIPRIMVRSGFVALLLVTGAACGERSGGQPPVCPQPTQLTGAQVQTRDVDRDKLAAELQRLERERDNARQWATDEGRRQAEGRRLRQLRRDVQVSAWTKLDALDVDMRELRGRLDLWTIKDRKAAFNSLREAEERRAVIETEIRQIHTEPELTMPQLRERLDKDLDSTAAKVNETLHGK